MRLPLIFAAVGAVLVLSACGAPSDEEQIPVDPGSDEPADTSVGLVTEVEGTSPLEDDPFVVAARAEDTGYLLAVNALDFSIPQFTETHSVEGAQELYDFFIDEYVTGGAPVVMFPGPSIWLPLEVNVNSSGDGADVLFCDASVDWAISKEFPEPAYDLANGEELTITLETDDRGNLVFAGENRTGVACDANGAPVQRFDPQPTVPDGPITLEDVTAP